jgi:hypothetical protein
MGLFDFLSRRNRESAMPDPESPEFQRIVESTALPDSTGTAGVAPGEWKSTADIPDVTDVPDVPPEAKDLRATEASEEVRDLLRRFGIDPEQPNQEIDSAKASALREEIAALLERHGADPGDAGNAEN